MGRLVAAAVILLMSMAACTRRDAGFVTPGMPAPNCDGIEHPEANPACPEWVAPWLKGRSDKAPLPDRVAPGEPRR